MRSFSTSLAGRVVIEARDREQAERVALAVLRLAFADYPGVELMESSVSARETILSRLRAFGRDAGIARIP